MSALEDVDANNNIISKYSFNYYDDGKIKLEQSAIPTQPFTMPDTVMTYTYDNWLSTWNGQAVVYDADGNMTTGPLGGKLVNFTYDSRNRLTGVGDTRYGYDAENNRISVSDGVYANQYVVNPNSEYSQTLIKTDAQGKQTFYVYGLGLIGQEEAGVYRRTIMTCEAARLPSLTSMAMSPTASNMGRMVSLSIAQALPQLHSCIMAEMG